jgi:serine/threonine-protein kinase
LLPVVQAVDIAAQVGEGLAYAHQHHVVHRDIKPANILVTADGRAKIADFGIARMRFSETRTQTGIILGSPKYISPEQVVGKRADHRSDIFSLGVILYQCLTGATPFNGEGLSALMYQITNHDPAPPSAVNPQVPVMLDYIVAKVLAKAPDARYQSAADFANDLRECRLQMETGQQGLGASLAATRPIPVAPQAAAATAPPSKPSDRDPDEETPTIPSPTKGLSRAFDSQEATSRLMRQLGADGIHELVSTKSFSAMSVAPTKPFHFGERPWGQRENLIFAATVGIAVVIATVIALV